MFTKNWIFILIVALGIGLSAVKRLNSVMNPHTAYKTQSQEFCNEFCGNLNLCLMDESESVKMHSASINQACNVLCRKGHPKFSECSETFNQCESLKACILSNGKNSTERLEP